MSSFGIGKGNKTNHKTGIAHARQELKRQQAEERNLAYSKLSLEEKLSRNSSKVKNKLTKGV